MAGDRLWGRADRGYGIIPTCCLDVLGAVGGEFRRGAARLRGGEISATGRDIIFIARDFLDMLGRAGGGGGKKKTRVTRVRRVLDSTAGNRYGGPWRSTMGLLVSITR